LGERIKKIKILHITSHLTHKFNIRTIDISGKDNLSAAYPDRYHAQFTECAGVSVEQSEFKVF